MQLACELVTWTQMLALHERPARKWEPDRLRLWSIAGRIAHHARRTHLKLAARAPQVRPLTRSLDHLSTLPTPI